MNDNTTLTASNQTNNLVLIESIPLDQNPAAVYLAGLSTDPGRRAQRQALAVIAEILTGQPDIFAVQWAALRFQHTQAIRAKLLELPGKNGKRAAATINRELSALKGVLRAAWRLGQLSAEDYTRAIDIKGAMGSTLPAGRELQAGELTALLNNCEDDTTPAGARDAAIIALAYSCGLRRAEIVGLDLEDYNIETGELRILGKRNKERTAYLINGAALAMGDWLAIRGDDPGPLFWPINKGGRLIHGRLTTQAIYNLFAKRAELASVKDFSPHDMRRTFVSDLLEAGADIATVSKMAGHSSVTTTARYDRRPEAAKIKAAGLLHVPYRGGMVR